METKTNTTLQGTAAEAADRATLCAQTGIMKLRRLCGLPAQISDAMQADIYDRLHDICSPLRLSYEDLRQLRYGLDDWLPADEDEFEPVFSDGSEPDKDADFSTRRQVFDGPTDFSINRLLLDYSQLHNLHYIGFSAPQSVEEAQRQLRAGKVEAVDNGQDITFPLNSAALYSYCLRVSAPAEVTDFLRDCAAAGMHGATTNILRGSGAKNEDLLPLVPEGCGESVRELMAEVNQRGLQIIEENRRGKRGQSAGDGERQTQNSTRTFVYQQAVAELLSKEIAAAPIAASGNALATRPIAQAIDALELNVTAGSVERLLDIIGPLSQSLKPTGDGSEYKEYQCRLLDIAKWHADTDNPTKKQIQSTFEALAGCSRLQLEFVEYVDITGKRSGRGRKPAALKNAQKTCITDEDGRKLMPYKVLANPLVATLRDAGAGGEYSGSTEVTLQIHHFVTDGRLKGTRNIDGKEYIVAAPARYIVSQQQLFEFHSSAEEIRFRNILLRASHKAQDDFIDTINSYTEKEQQAATEEERKKLRRSRQIHYTRDEGRLRDYFDRAKTAGLIQSYSRRKARQQGGSKRTKYVWQWARGEKKPGRGA